MKRCSRCEKMKPKADFGTDKRATTGLRCACRECDSSASGDWNRRHREQFNEYRKQYHRDKRAYVLVSTAKKRSKKRGLPFDLQEHRKEIQARIDAGRCELTGIPFDLKNGRTYASPSIDRIVPAQGYVYSNIRIVLNLMNCALGDWGEETLNAVLTIWQRERARVGTTGKDASGPEEANRPTPINAV